MKNIMSFTGTFSLQTGFEASEMLILLWIPAVKSGKFTLMENFFALKYQ
jgi:hypothetical protein